MSATPRHDWDPALYAAHAAFVPALGGAVLDLLAPRAGEHILDIGCGDGVLTARIAAAGASVVGIDADAAMVAAAMARGVDARQRDALSLDFGGAFDAVFSNAALHWVGAPAVVTAGVARALKPGGRYVGEFGGHGNIAAIRVAVRAVLATRGYRVEPMETSYYPTAEAFRNVLENGGFRVDMCEIIPRPTPLPTGMTAWLNTFRGGFIESAGVPADKRAQVIEDIRAMLRPVLADEAGNWIADYVRIRFHAHLPPARDSERASTKE
ncbi:class I SAM-dependent methyltransferase [Polymorphobacter fuscus]|uniref:Methyltransferase domain-containing protein n=1 Tax=Sandarakinorhabdus fusca TaxID=1439888 RepID=A0A7C9GTB8_9SPHN|nr:class I SAM-dependent methyltransferase [Polymorphobacter fuscus]KAB7648515.1 class I SAM-dependent methyltransferase [Polymorphobacter fuscus]MQT16049.1 methyltransferase domain-containing protein [Polymorphobacter fuscus]NJC07673.1 SAM-dependent methyltransferase [Polymorphobacter fuscus]